jgi:hypothetical protein
MRKIEKPASQSMQPHVHAAATRAEHRTDVVSGGTEHAHREHGHGLAVTSSASREIGRTPAGRSLPIVVSELQPRATNPEQFSATPSTRS